MTLELPRPEMQGDFARFSPVEYERRYAKLREAMTAQNLDALVVWGESSGWGELSGARTGMASARYISNFADQLTEYVVFPKAGEPILFTFSRSHSTCARGISVVPIEFASLDIAMSVAERITALGGANGRIGLIGLSTILGQSLPSDQYDRLRAELPQATFVVATELVENVRAIKSSEEMEWIRYAAEHTDAAFQAVLRSARIGMREFELHADVARAYLPDGGHLNFQALGATPMASPVIVSPGYHKSRREFQPGDIILAEISAGYWGYGGYSARPVAVGGAPPPAYLECFSIAARALDAMVECLRPDVTIVDVLDAFKKQLPKNWRNASPLIRGWGLAIEPPYLDNDAPAPAPMRLAEGMVLAVSVNPVSPDGRIGLRLGDLYVITANGATRLQATPLEFFHVA